MSTAPFRQGRGLQRAIHESCRLGAAFFSPNDTKSDLWLVLLTSGDLAFARAELAKCRYLRHMSTAPFRQGRGFQRAIHSSCRLGAAFFSPIDTDSDLWLVLFTSGDLAFARAELAKCRYARHMSTAPFRQGRGLQREIQ